MTGLAVVPSVDELDGVGRDAVVTMGGLRRADPEATPSAAAVKLRSGAPAGTAERLGIGPGKLPTGRDRQPGPHPLHPLLAGVVGALAVLTVVHVMATSVHH